jgi:glycosyltransferase involved in cell wall biosynthesis
LRALFNIGALGFCYKHIKSWLPRNVKYPFWYIFKAPQRSFHPHSLLNDLKGIFIFLGYPFFKKPVKKLQPISICTGLYNRSDMYINVFLDSLNNCKHQDLIELSVVDCHSTDMVDLEKKIKEKWGGKFVFTTQQSPFTRAMSFNTAVNQSRSDLLFICDADMSIPKNIVSLCNYYVAPKRVWYPIYFFLYPTKYAKLYGKTGEWEQYGSKGMLGVYKKDWKHIGGLNESYTNWGEEDTELWKRFHQAGYIVIRNRQQQFLHHWHPSFNSKYKHLNEF